MVIKGLYYYTKNDDSATHIGEEIITVFNFTNRLIIQGINNMANVLEKKQKVSFDTSQWKGFNLTAKFGTSNHSFNEDDFKNIANLGFTYIRLPIDYRSYIVGNDWNTFNEESLKDIDQAIALGEKYNLHITINLHRAPGYCISPPAEKMSLWTEKIALDAFCDHWRMFAKRYNEIPPQRLSFNLLNEPRGATPEQYLAVFTAALGAIHEIDPDRQLIIDGMEVGSIPFKDFVNLDYVIQSTRGYHPGAVSHYMASWWEGSRGLPEPVWPLPLTDDTNKIQTLEEYFAPWKEIQEQGVSIFVGECGCFNKTPHKVALDWMRSWLQIYREHNVGWALWNFQGAFGILDSKREDVTYEDWNGHKLDRAMLDLLQEYLH